MVGSNDFVLELTLKFNNKPQKPKTGKGKHKYLSKPQPNRVKSNKRGKMMNLLPHVEKGNKKVTELSDSSSQFVPYSIK